MPKERFFLNSLLEKECTYYLTGKEHHHLAHVMRAKPGDWVELVNGKGILAQSIVEEIQKDRSLLKVKEMEILSENSFKIILAQAIPRFNRLDTILEKGTELGMDELWLFPGIFSEKKDFSENQKERIESIFISSLKQCGRLFLPKFCLMPPLKEWKPQNYPIFFGDLSAEASSFYQAWQSVKPENGAIIVIGPEKGLHPKEIQHLKQIEGYGVTIHTNILRTDTAPLCALTLMHHFAKK